MNNTNCYREVLPEEVLQEGDSFLIDNNKIKTDRVGSLAGVEFRYYRPLEEPGPVSPGNSPKKTMQTFSTGAKRETKASKGRFDLLPYEGLLEIAKHFESGAAAHGDRNWEKGIPLSVYLSSMRRHAMQVGQKDDENHAAAAAWNAVCYITTRARIAAGLLPKELNDVPVA